MAAKKNQKVETIQVPFNFNPRPYQLALFQALDGVKGKPETKKKRALLRWHRRAGKDKACFCYMVKEAASVPGNYFYVFPFASDARRALWENVDSGFFKLLDHIPEQIIDRRNNQDMLVLLKNGSTIRVIGLDNNPDGIRGTAIRGIVFSEFAFQDPTPYRNCLPAIKEANGWVIINSTPNGRNHFYDMYLTANRSPNWYVSSLQTMWPERDHYSALVSPEALREYIEEEGSTEEDAEREYGVSFSTGMKGSFYADQVDQARDSGRIGTFPPDNSKWVDTFWDLGVDDSTAVWFRQVSGNGIVWIDYYENSGKDIAFYVDILQSKGYRYRTHFLPHDGGNRSIQTVTTTDELFRLCCKEANISDDVVVTKKVKLQDSINAVRSRFSRYYFNEGLVSDGIEKLSLYHRRFDRKRKVFLKEPVHDWCVTGDTKVRTLSGWKEIKDVTTLDKVWGYSHTERRLIPTDVTFSGITRRNAELVEVFLDNNKSIRCTPDHLFLLRDGSYKKAEDLVKNDSLMPFYETRNSGYVKIELNDGSYGLEHSLVFHRFNSSHIVGEMHVDHIDGNKYNNDPSNLQSLTHQEHCSKTFLGKSNKDRKHIDTTNYDREFYDRKSTLKDCGFCGNEFEADHKTVYCSKECVKGNHRKHHSRANRAKRKAEALNHKVRKVERLNYREDVYDLTVPETSNFVAEGVVIHNCSHCADALRTEAIAEEFADDLEIYQQRGPSVISEYDPYGA